MLELHDTRGMTGEMSIASHRRAHYTMHASGCRLQGMEICLEMDLPDRVQRVAGRGSNKSCSEAPRKGGYL